MNACGPITYSRLFATHDDRFAFVVDLECTLSVTDDKRKIEEIFHRLRKVVWVDDEFEKVDRASSFKNIFNFEDIFGRFVVRPLDILFPYFLGPTFFLLDFLLLLALYGAPFFLFY